MEKLDKYLDKITQGDALKLIKEIPDNSIDLIVVDPPYLIKKNKIKKIDKNDINNLSRINKNKCLSANEIYDLNNGFDLSILDEFDRVMKNTNIYIFCSKDQIYDYYNYYTEKGCNINLLVWCKTNSLPSINGCYKQDIEYIIFAKKGGKKLNGNVKTLSRFYISQTNVYDKKLYLHPTIKPLELVKNYIINSSDEGDIVLDAFMGSGTTAVACKQLNRHFVGFELNEKYHQIACERLKGTNQLEKCEYINLIDME